MTWTWRSLALLVLAVAAGACATDEDVPTAGTAAPGADADAGGDGDGDGDGAGLTVVVDGGEFDRLTYTVTCGAAGAATVVPEVPGVDPASACERLRDPAVVELLVSGPPQDRLCTEVYGGPQVATITGRLAGEAVQAEVSRVDGCQIDTWDRLLAGFLPPTVGVQAEG